MMNTVLDKITSRVYDRRSKWSTFEVFELPMSVSEPTIMGSYSMCMLKSRNRIIDLTKSIQIDGVKETPSSLARDYLYTIYRRGPKAHDKQSQNVDGKIKPLPSVSRPCKFTDGIYVDISATYWSILNCIGWNVDYNPPYWLGNGRPPIDFPWPENKPARNCLVSASASPALVVQMPNSIPIAMPSNNRLKNKQLICLIGDVLNSIAAFALRQGAVYLNVDGYILTDERAAQNVMDEIAEWGLSARIRNRGDGSVSGPGLYSIGQHKSRREMIGEHWVYNIIEPEYTTWLKRSFSKLAYAWNGVPTS